MMAKSLAERREGLHHLSFSLPKDEFYNKFKELKEKGYQMIDEKPRRNNYGLEYGFVHPKSTARVLVQFTRRWVSPNGKKLEMTED
jgi:methylmalonyl-CoA/ethylmalonyl-CoA epimerase